MTSLRSFSTWYTFKKRYILAGLKNGPAKILLKSSLPPSAKLWIGNSGSIQVTKDPSFCIYRFENLLLTSNFQQQLLIQSHVDILEMSVGKITQPYSGGQA